GGPAASVSDGRVLEGNTIFRSLTLTVTLSAATTQQVTVGFFTAGGTAEPGVDYVAVGKGSVVFEPGETVQSLAITVNGDGADEDDETFNVILENPVNATIGDGLGVGTIIDDDPLPLIEVADAEISEGDGGASVLTFTVSLSLESGREVRASYATVDGTASAGSDYQPASGALLFLPGESSHTIAVTVNGDLLPEPDESFGLVLSGLANAGAGDLQATGLIRSDDPPLALYLPLVAR
ncbi:MAG TPA: Calx-beta domain-containing protein, partial [Herpetosiphonaceae bacterium]